MPGRAKVRQEQLLSGLQASGNINYMAEVRLKSPGALARESVL